MKRILILSFAIIMVIAPFVCDAQNSSKKATQTSVPEKVEAYYFHMTSRCVTCKAVESEAKKDISSLYGNKVSFKSINIEEASGKSLGESLNISGQALVIVKGKKIINLTNQGFMYARTDTLKFKSVIKESIDGLLK